MKKPDIYPTKRDACLTPSPDLIAIVRQSTDTILLSFSAGKDSLAMWLYLQPHFRIIPYFMYLIPGLRSDEVALQYYEEWFGTHIIRMPHPLLYQKLNDCTYQPPERVARIHALGLPDFTYADIDNALFRHYGLTCSYCAVGMRMKDGIDRRNMMMQKGVLGAGRRRFYYGIWDWDVNQVAAKIQRAGVKIHPNYAIMGRTILAIDYQYLRPFRQHYPDDYEKLREWFPLLDLEFYRYKMAAV
jgi:hypothetical protein